MKQKRKTLGFIVLSVIFSISWGLFVHFELFWPTVSEVYEKSMNYSEELYREYRLNVENMLKTHQYTCKYPTRVNFEIKDDQTTTVVIQIGDYDDNHNYADYVTAKITGFGTENQEITFERSRKSAEEAHNDAQEYLNLMRWFTILFVLIIVVFIVYLIFNCIKGHYARVYCPISVIAMTTVLSIVVWHFLF